MKDKIFIALDVPTLKEAYALVETLGNVGAAYKIGYQLAFSGGLELAKELSKAGKSVFLDMKLHDIGNTISHAVENVAKMGVDFLTIHAYPQTIKAASEGARGAKLKLLAVTVLTSYDEADVRELGFKLSVKELFTLRAKQAKTYGADGLILSPQELSEARKLVGQEMLLVTPGIRPEGSEKGDQKRVLTPEQAFTQGADYLVIGRPITAAENPRQAMQSILNSL
jgi:orotidine-5'-phosphate decarboxylase